MKRLLLAALILASSVASACLGTAVSSSLMVTLEAQSLPVTRLFVWAPNDPAEQVISYKVIQDAGPQVTVLASACSPTDCQANVVFTTAGTHTVSVAALNEWGEGAAATLTVNLIVPKAPSGLKLR